MSFLKGRVWRKRTPAPVPSERVVSKEYGAGVWSQLFFVWMSPLMSVGHRRPLENNDIWLVNPARSVGHMTESMQISFARRVERGEKNPLLWSIYETFKKEIVMGGICRFVADIFLILAPFVLKYLIAYVDTAYHADRENTESAGAGVGIGYVIGITAMTILQSLGTNHFIYRGMITGGQIRGVLISLIFQKSLKLSPKARSQGQTRVAAENTKENKVPDLKKKIPADVPGWSNGRIFNIMSTDTARIDQASGTVHLIWTSPIAILVALALLILNLTYSALAGFAVLVIGLASVTHAVKSLGSRRAIINKITDQRISRTREMLHAIRSVKLFGWENAFSERLEDLRAKEVRSVRILLTTRSAIGAVSMAMPIFSQMIAFITYSYTVRNMDPAATFSSLALFQSLRTPLNWIPLAIGHAMDALASLRRIEEFLLAEEAVDEAIHDTENHAAVELRNADFTWERSIATSELTLKTQDSSSSISSESEKPSGETHTDEKHTNSVVDTELTKDQEKGAGTPIITMEQDPFSLRSLDIAIGRGELIAVIGDVGSGKSSLLAAIAGDMRKTGGEMIIGTSRAYCPQSSWIQNASVRENIIFGTKFDATRYGEVVHACALQVDIDALPHGDMTEIGERGVTLSGGQKQRINIARAIYVDRDIILMDDPLSAVDAHVGQHIFDNAICGMLSKKCRILATHQLHVLSSCDRIVCMDNGRIESVDTYENMIRKNDRLGRFLTEKQLAATPEKVHSDEMEIKDPASAKEGGKIKSTSNAETLMQDEGKSINSISWGVYAAYTRASGSIFNALWILILLVLFRCSNLMVNLWLAYWVSDDFPLQREQYIGVYVGLSFIQSMILFAFSVSVSMMGTHASKYMLNTAVRQLLRAPMSFFDTTPLGRILHRLSKDTDVMDNNLTDALRMFSVVSSLVVASFILIIVYYYYFVVALVPLTIFLLYSASYYRTSARELKRHQALRDAHVFAKFSEAQSGCACIRAYGLQGRFSSQIETAIDEMNGAYFLTFSNQRWLGIRLDAVGIGLVFATGILVVVDRFHISPSISGLVLSYILQIIELLQYIVRQQAEVENAMNGTARLHQYCDSLESEAPLQLPNAPSPWPLKGSVNFENVQLRYRAGLPLALKNLNLSINGGEVMGIVGRTGAGKSSITSALFRLSELSGGRIMIDDVDIAKLGLHTLRKNLSIIPQDPVLFAGTVRSNLDPFSQHNDYDLNVALQRTHLVDNTEPDKQSASRPENRRVTLDSVVDEDGSNFSLGQRQLMAFARALIQGGKIMIVDEGTSAVDSQTDDNIQRTISNVLRGTTRLIIAHRLRTVLSYDRVCVLDQGTVIEVGEPLELWRREGGVFRGMCDSSRIVEKDFFRAKDMDMDMDMDVEHKVELE